MSRSVHGSGIKLYRYSCNWLHVITTKQVVNETLFGTEYDTEVISPHNLRPKLHGSSDSAADLELRYLLLRTYGGQGRMYAGKKLSVRFLGPQLIQNIVSHTLYYKVCNKRKLKLINK